MCLINVFTTKSCHFIIVAIVFGMDGTGETLNVSATALFQVTEFISPLTNEKSITALVSLFSVNRFCLDGAKYS